MNLYSFDVFDTVITRLLYRSTDVFLPVGNDLAKFGLISNVEDWARLRAQVEIDTRRSSRQPEITMDEIYLAVSARCGWNTEQSKKAKAIELQWERRLTRPIVPVRMMIKRLTEVGTRFIFISDTYLAKPEVLNLLRAGGFSVREEDLFVSSDHMATKADGTLFQYVKSRVSPAVISLHIGDNYKSDVVSARTSGLPARHFDESRSNRYERALYRNLHASPLVRSAVAGAARAVRLSRGHDTVHAQTVWETGVNVIGPLLAGFILWVLNDAQQRGIRRLYFVARDGWIMREVALRLHPWIGNQMELRYLYGSRQAWHLPGMDTNAPPPDWLLENLDTTTLDTLLGRVNLTWEQCAPCAAAAGFSVNDRELVIGKRRKPMLQRLLTDAFFRSLLRIAVHDARETLHAYLIREGFADGVSSALVDIGWFGRMQESLNAVLRTNPVFDIVRLFGYYLGMSTRVRPSIIGAWSCYISERRLTTNSVALHQNHALAEIICQANHGTTIGYRRLPSGDIQPALANFHGIDEFSWGTGIQQEATLAFAATLAEAAGILQLSPVEVAHHLRRVAPKNWARFALFPTRNEANVYGAFRHDREQGVPDAGRTTETAPILGFTDLLHVLAAGSGKASHYSNWVEGSVRRAGRLARLLLPLILLRAWCSQTARYIRCQFPSD
jgi:FMN phosphatase YigB (HAD superfamily)